LVEGLPPPSSQTNPRTMSKRPEPSFSTGLQPSTPYTTQNRASKAASRKPDTQRTAPRQADNLKTKGMYILLLTHTPIHRSHIRAFNTHPTNGIPDPQTRTIQNSPATHLRFPQKPTIPDMPKTNLNKTRHLTLIQHEYIWLNKLHFYSTKSHKQQPPV
jgi:hypothetical protein